MPKWCHFQYLVRLLWKLKTQEHHLVQRQSFKDPVQCIMTNNTSTYTDILSMNVSWLMEDLEPFENQFNILESIVCTIAIFIIFVMAIIVHRAFYRLMKRLPGRDINQIIFPYMV